MLCSATDITLSPWNADPSTKVMNTLKPVSSPAMRPGGWRTRTVGRSDKGQQCYILVKFFGHRGVGRPLALPLILALGATVAAVVVMVTSHESATVLNMKFTANYSSTEAFVYFVVAYAVAAGYSLIVLLLLISCKNRCWRIVLFLDLVMVVLLASSMSAALAIAQVGKKGNSSAGWLPICNQVPRFCEHVGGAIVSGIIGSSLYLLIVLHAVYNVLGSLFSLKP